MRQIKKYIVLICCVSMMLTLYSCGLPFGKKKVDTHFSASTNISYSSGSDSNWSYGNQRKEFPKDDECYARIGSTVVAEKKSGRNKNITVTYTFTGTENCNIELSDGIADKVDSKDPDVQIYTREIAAKEAKKAAENIVIFRYIPDTAVDSVSVQVTYDDHVLEQYDVRNTIYFSEY